MGRKLLHLLNGLLTCVVVAALVIAGAYAGYSLWDNQQIYNSAEKTYSGMREIRASMGMTTLSAMEQLLEESRIAREAKVAEEAQAAQEAPETTNVTVPEVPTVEVATAAAATPVISDTPTVTEAPTAEITELVTEAPSVTDVSIVTEVLAVSNEASNNTDIPETPRKAAETIADATETSESTNITTPAPTATPAPTPTATPTPAPTDTPAPTPDDSPFGQLKEINKEITAWITMSGTAIDYPVLQGKTNRSYINKDVYGEFSIIGSIFLDSRNRDDYTDVYNLLYGHNMSEHRMFSDVNLYKEEEFFEKNTLGILLMPDGCHILESISVILLPASDSQMFNPENWSYLDNEDIYRTVQKDAMYINEKGLEDLRAKIDAGETPRLVSLSTCSGEFTDARTILLTLMDP